MKQIKVDKLMLYGQIDGQFEEGEYMHFDAPITISGGRIFNGPNGSILISYDTLKENIYGHNITPKVILYTNEEMINESKTMLSYKDIDCREINDDEYVALNEYLKQDYNPTETGEYNDIKRSRLTVYDVNQDFKIINNNDCSIYQWSDGKESVQFDTFRYAYKHGLIYPYDSNENEDDCEEDIDELFK